MAEPAKIVEESDSRISIEWTDGKETSYEAVQLRKSCPCAGCINEWTGEKILDSKSVPDDLNFSHISIVGRYALNFHFSDGHETGIFSFRFLKDLAENERQ
ncbi:MAG: DUF971 domain-containing protein [Acidobacteriota bacterium]|nr:DUF971 domain-containing protein [Acidobacteriota bacterium]MDH3531071.1 DUF971 domain-containing protein [Acidobacteriota bacterium]